MGYGKVLSEILTVEAYTSSLLSLPNLTVVLLQLFCYGCPATIVLPWLSWPVFHVSIVMFWLTCHGCPFQTIISGCHISVARVRPSCPSTLVPSSPVPCVLPLLFSLAILLFLPCPSCPPGCDVLTILPRLSYPVNPVGLSCPHCQRPTVHPGCPLPTVLLLLSCPGCSGLS
jgi:hypothetical protein